VIQTEVKNKLSDEILFGRLAKGGELQLELDGEQIAFHIPEAGAGGSLKVKETVGQE